MGGFLWVELPVSTQSIWTHLRDVIGSITFVIDYHLKNFNLLYVVYFHLREVMIEYGL